MEISVRKNEHYRDVVFKEGNTTLDLGLLDVEETRQLASSFLSAVYDLVNHQFDNSEDYFQWLKDNT